MNAIEKIKNHYEKVGNRTYYATNKHNQLLLFHPNLKRSKIYGLFICNDDDDFINIGCLEFFRNEFHLLFRDCSHNDYKTIISKISKIDEDTEKEINADYIDSCLRPQIVFENQKSIVLEFLKDNGYKLLSL